MKDNSNKSSIDKFYCYSAEVRKNSQILREPPKFGFRKRVWGPSSARWLSYRMRQLADFIEEYYDESTLDDIPGYAKYMQIVKLSHDYTQVK